jgi:putative transposase
VHVKSSQKIHPSIQSESRPRTIARREDSKRNQSSTWRSSQCVNAVAKRIYRTISFSVWRGWSRFGSRSANCRTRTDGGKIDDAIRDRKKSIEYLTDEEKRQIVTELKPNYSVRLVCEVLSVNRSSLYYQRVEEDAKSETELKAAIEEIAGEFPRYGYRRITQQLKRQGIVVNHKRVARLMKEMGLAGKVPKRRCRTTNSNHGFARYSNQVAGLSIERPNQVWVGDITYIRLGEGFVYLAVLMDVFTRCIRGWHLGRGLDHSLTLTALNQALEHHQPEIHHSDQGVQYAATGYVEVLKQRNIQISMAEVGEPTQNGYAERLMRTIKEEEVDLSEYRNFEEAYTQIKRFLEDVYMKKRIHSSIGYLTPIEFESEWRSKQ